MGFESVPGGRHQVRWGPRGPSFNRTVLSGAARIGQLLLLACIGPGAACRTTKPAGDGVSAPQSHLLPQQGAVEQRAEVTRAGGIDGLGTGTLDVASYNLAWFGDPGHGPRDDLLQRRQAQAALSAVDADLWGLVEIVSADQFAALLAALPGYAGILASDPSVLGGAAFFGRTEQKLGLLYRSQVATLERARLILMDVEQDFAGRPPLELTLRISMNGYSASVVVVVVHAKCCSDARSLQRRRRASAALKAYLDALPADLRVWVIGDFNDDVDVSISAGSVSPYSAFVQDAEHYRFVTADLAARGVSSTSGHHDLVDHHLLNRAAAVHYIEGSAAVVRVDRLLERYAQTTSDHLPVISRYAWPPSEPQAAPGTRLTSFPTAPSPDEGPPVFINEVGANEPGSDPAAEFVEIVNRTTRVVSLAGWTLRDAQAVRHRFGTSESLSPGCALVVLGGGTGASAPPGSVRASFGALGLGNSGDEVTLSDSAQVVIDRVGYTRAQVGTDGVSLNRTPDGDFRGAWGSHGQLVAARASPGTRASGGAWCTPRSEPAPP